MISQTNSQIQVYSRLIKLGEEYILEYSQVETITYNTVHLALPGPVTPPTPSFSSEYYLLIGLLCLVPILIVMAFIYGKRMGQREKTSVRSPTNENILEKLTISQKSTKETSSPTSSSDSDGPVLPDELENLPPSVSYNNSNASSQTEKEEKSPVLNLPQKDYSVKEVSYRNESSSCQKSVTEERSQESFRSSIIDETQTATQALEIISNVRSDLDGLHAMITYEIDPSKANHTQYPIPHKELISLHKDESQVKNRKVKFGVSTEMENGRLIKKETLETITTYEKDAVDPELNAQALKRGISNISQASGGSLPLQIKADELSEPLESPIMNKKVSFVSGKSESEICALATTNPKLSHTQSENRSEPLPIMPYIPDNSKILALLESEDLPDETGKFNKVFKDPVLIGEGSFGAVYKVTHRLDSKLYAVKKIKLPLKRHDDLQKRGKVLREVFAISNLQHPNIVRYSTCWVEIESSKRVTRVNTTKTLDATKKSLLAIKPNPSSPSLKKKRQISEPLEESSMAFEFESRAEETQQEEQTVDCEDLTFAEESKPLYIEKSISRTIDEVDESSCAISEMTTPGKPSYFGEYDLYLYIQMEFCAGLNLRNYLDMEDRKIERKPILKMFKKLLEGVGAIHKCGILHRDLKPANIFLDNAENVKIGDFGLASLGNAEESSGNHQINHLHLNMERSHSMMVGTPMYSSPEQEKGKKYNQKTDVYSLGLILCEMLNNFSTSHERYLFFNKIKKEYTLPQEFKNKYAEESDLIIRMTAESPEARPTVEDTIIEINKLLENETN